MRYVRYWLEKNAICRLRSAQKKSVNPKFTRFQLISIQRQTFLNSVEWQRWLNCTHGYRLYARSAVNTRTHFTRTRWPRSHASFHIVLALRCERCRCVAARELPLLPLNSNEEKELMLCFFAVCHRRIDKFQISGRLFNYDVWTGYIFLYYMYVQFALYNFWPIFSVDLRR